MTTEVEVDLFCEYYDYNELANLSDIGTNTETTTASPPEEPPPCALEETTNEPPDGTEATPTCPDGDFVKEEPTYGFITEIRTVDEPVVDFSRCGAQPCGPEADPLAISLRDLKVELLEADDTNNVGLRLPRISDVPQVFTNHDVCNKKMELNEINAYNGVTGCQIIIEEVGYLRITENGIKLEDKHDDFVLCPLCDFHAKNAQGLKIHRALKHEVRQKSLTTEQEFQKNCNNNIDGKSGTGRSGFRRSKIKPSQYTVQVDHRSSKTFNKVNALQMNCKGVIRVFTCSTCEYRTARKNHFWRHLTNQHLKTAGKRLDMEVINTYSSISWVKKTEYGKILEHNKLHVRGNGPLQRIKVNAKKVQQFNCFACEYKSSSRYTLEQHLKQQHIEYATETGTNDGKKIGSGEGLGKKDTNKTCSDKKKPSPQKSRTSRDRSKVSTNFNNEDIETLKGTNFICEKCDFYSRYKNNLVRHFRVRHARAVCSYITKSVYCCNECLYDCENADGMIHHLKKNHQHWSPAKPLSNVEALLKTKDTKTVKNIKERVGVKRKRDVIENNEPKKNNVKKQKLDSADPDDKEVSRQKYSCSQCTFFSKHLVSWKRHILEVHGDARKFPCSACDSIFKRKEQRNMHYMALHVAKRGTFLCSGCLFQGTTKEKVKNHIKGQHNTKVVVLEKK